MLIEELKEDFDISTIAFKLASMISASTFVQGNNNIGKSESDIKRLIENSSRYESDGRSGDRNSRGGRGGRFGSKGGDSRGGRPSGDRNSRGPRPSGDRPSGDRPRGDRPSGDRAPRPSGDRSRKRD